MVDDRHSTKIPPEAFRDVPVLVTGGAGFIGSHVCEQALAAGHEVAALDDLSNGKRENLPPEVKLYVDDVRNADAVQRAFTDFRPQAVSHQAAQASVPVSVRQPVFDAEVNLLGSVNVLQACMDAGTSRFVFASTGGAIYGDIPEPEIAAVGRVPRPETPYAASKLAVEGYLKFYRDRGLACTSLRYANIYGPRQDPHGEAGVVAIFCQRLLAGEAVQINARRETGDRGCLRDYTYVADVVKANLAALNGALDADILDVGTGVATDTQTLLGTLASAAGVSPEVRFAPPRDGDVERSVLNSAEFVHTCGALTVLPTGLAQTMQWFSRQGVHRRLS